LGDELEGIHLRIEKDFVSLSLYVSTVKTQLEDSHSSFRSAREQVKSEDLSPKETKDLQLFDFFLSIHDGFQSTFFNTTFTYLLAIFEAFVSDSLRAVLTYRPEIMKTRKKELSYENILSKSDLQQIIRFMVEKELREMTSVSIKEQWLNYEKRFGVPFQSISHDVDRLCEANGQRNLLMHNGGIANEIYLSSVKNPKLKLGERVQISAADLDVYAGSLKRVSTHLKNSHIEKFRSA
jgi:hypothetical protein